jgi:hypothetical protein
VVFSDIREAVVSTAYRSPLFHPPSPSRSFSCTWLDAGALDHIEVVSETKECLVQRRCRWSFIVSESRCDEVDDGVLFQGWASGSCDQRNLDAWRHDAEPLRHPRKQRRQTVE